jgi:hypothetical protein
MSTASSLSPPPVSTPKPRAVRVVIGGNVFIPADVVDLDSFCRWTISDQYPERGQFSFLHGTIWVDLSMEDIYRHNQVKEAIGRVLGQLILDAKMGRFLPDGVLLRNSAADLSTEPDATFVSYAASVCNVWKAKHLPVICNWTAHRRWCWKSSAKPAFTRTRWTCATSIGEPE